jgi:hypothetical protein
MGSVVGVRSVDAYSRCRDASRARDAAVRGGERGAGGRHAEPASGQAVRARRAVRRARVAVDNGVPPPGRRMPIPISTSRSRGSRPTSCTSRCARRSARLRSLSRTHVAPRRRRVSDAFLFCTPMVAVTRTVGIPMGPKPEPGGTDAVDRRPVRSLASGLDPRSLGRIPRSSH